MVIGSSSLSSAGVTSASLPEERNGSHSRERSNRFTCGEMRAVWAFSSGEKKIARDPECSTMYATSSALRRVLIGTRTPPASRLRRAPACFLTTGQRGSMSYENIAKKNVAPAASDLLLGRGVRFEGKLTFAGTVRIDASFVGTIVTADVLVVGEGARIDAT